MDTLGRIGLEKELMKAIEKEKGEARDRMNAYEKNVKPVKLRTTMPDDAVPIVGFPDPKCSDCYGRGHITRIIENVRKVEPCHCVKPKKR